MNSFLSAVPAAPRRTTPIRLGIASLLAGLVPAQAWTQLQPAVRPAHREGHCMAFDAARNVTLLFGGWNYQSVAWHTDTWTWNGTEWTLLQPGVAPQARAYAGMAYDAARQRIVMFGGLNSSNETLADTWEWNGAAWLQLAPLHAPVARAFFAMAYDAARANTVLFGGYVGPLGLADTWTWNGTDWTQLAPAHSPSARMGAKMVDASARARCVLFGGHAGTWQAFDDTWEWNGIDWTQQATAHAPSPRSPGGLAYDAPNQRVVLFGGAMPDALGDTWEYDGVDWALQVPSAAPSPRNSCAMVYDDARANVVLFGGSSMFADLDETWQYTHGGTAATFTAFGQGCPGSFGTPQLALAGGLPVLGTTLKVACTNLQLDHFTTLWIGFSKTSWLLGNLPYDLGALGMPGCTLFVSSDMPLILLNWNGTALWQTAIPNDPQLNGCPFYLQAGVIDRVNALGMVVTNAGEVRIGDH